MEELGKACFGAILGLLVSVPLVIWSLTPSKTLVDYRIEAAERRKAARRKHLLKVIRKSRKNKR